MHRLHQHTTIAVRTSCRKPDTPISTSILGGPYALREAMASPFLEVQCKRWYSP